MATPTETGQIRPGTTHNPESEILYNYPEDFPIPQSGFRYGKILHCLFERADAVLELMNPDSVVSDSYNDNAFWIIRSFLEQGVKIANQLDAEEAHKEIETREVAA